MHTLINTRYSYILCALHGVLLALSATNLRAHLTGLPHGETTFTAAQPAVARPAPASAKLRVLRGPYLQLATASNIVVRWRTSLPSAGTVHYGADARQLTNSVSVPRLTTDHVVRITGLAADQPYYYSVGTPTETLAGGDDSHVFHTAPRPGTEKPTRIWALGDCGTADARAARVRDGFLRWTGDHPVDLLLMLGDNAYPNGTDAQYQAAVYDMYAPTLRNTPLWSTLGNHDGRSASSKTETGAYYDMFTLPRNGEAGGIPSGTEAYYAFDYGQVHFVCLNSFDLSRATDAPMLKWLEDDLAANTQKWTIAFWHHPPYTKGSHDSDRERELIEMRGNALPILERGGVDLVLTGHSHSYERSYLLHGHYGHSSTLQPSQVIDSGNGRILGDGPYDTHSSTGTVYIVAGSSGKISGGPLDHPVMFASINELGSLAIDVRSNRLDVRFVGVNGDVRDRFTIVKDAP